MKRLAITVMSGALATGALIAAPAWAQQNQGQGGNLGSVLEQVGRSLTGQGGASSNPQQDAQQTRQQSEQQYRKASDQQLQQDKQRLDDARARIDASEQALDQEMNRRGMRTGSNESYGGGDHYTGNRSGNNGEGFSGSSTPPGYSRQQNNGANNGYSGTNGNYGSGSSEYRGPTGNANNNERPLMNGQSGTYDRGNGNNR